MRIHSDTLTRLEIRKAATRAHVTFTRLTEYGSRSRAGAFDVILSGNSGRRQNFGGEDEAASWDQWGIFLGTLFLLDPAARTPYYDGAEEFVWRTGNRFTPSFTFADCHVRHAWGYGDRSATETYSVATCERGKSPCGAIQRWPLYGHTFADLSQ